MISSHSNPKVKQVAQWQTNSGKRREEGVFLAEGFKMCEEAPERDVREIYITQEALEKAGTQPALREKLERIGYETVSSEVFRKMSDTRTPQGILCVVKRQETDLERLLAAENPLLIVLEDLQDPGNLGTIVRTGEGAGVTGIVMSQGTVDIYNPKTIRSTMGSVYRMPFCYTEDLHDAVTELKGMGIHIYAAHLAGQRFYDEEDYSMPCGFLIGNEGSGLRPEVAACADVLVRIPMEGMAESLNAAVAAAVLMFEVSRQRKRY